MVVVVPGSTGPLLLHHHLSGAPGQLPSHLPTPGLLPRSHHQTRRCNGPNMSLFRTKYANCNRSNMPTVTDQTCQL